MKGLCFILFFGAAQAEQTQFQSGLSAVQQVVSGMPASSRQVAISKLLETVEKAPTLSPQAIEILTNVSAFLMALVPTLFQDAVFDQHQLDVHERDYEQCTNMFAGPDSSWGDYVAGVRDNHTACRDEEGPLLAAQISECEDLLSEMSDLHTIKDTTCAPLPPVHMNNAQDWINFYNAGGNYFNNLQPNFVDYKQRCEEALDARESKRVECKDWQLDLEYGMCGWYWFRDFYCEQGADSFLQECYTNAERELNETADYIRTLAAGRVQMILTIWKVDCLVTKIINEQPIAADDCQFQLSDEQNQSLTINYPPIPHPAECNTEPGSPVNPNPDHDNWPTHANSGPYPPNVDCATNVCPHAITKCTDFGDF